jgi:hypothetical protein
MIGVQIVAGIEAGIIAGIVAEIVAGIEAGTRIRTEAIMIQTGMQEVGIVAGIGELTFLFCP